MDNKIFRVEYGSIYRNQTGSIIETMAVIIDKSVGLLKYGDAQTGLYDYYNEMVGKYKKCGLEDIANDLIYVQFDRYEGILTIEEICTFANYMVMCSCNGPTIYKMLQMDSNELKEKLKSLSEYGY